MPARNPIDQRHANRKDTGCPVFWRRVGIPLSRFFAFYPWAMNALMFAVVALLFTGGGGTLASDRIVGVFRAIFGIGHLLLLLPALMWFLFFFAAALRGFQRLYTWFVYAVLWFFGSIFILPMLP